MLLLSSARLRCRSSTNTCSLPALPSTRSAVRLRSAGSVGTRIGFVWSGRYTSGRVTAACQLGNPLHRAISSWHAARLGELPLA